MSRRAAKFTEADALRAIKAVKRSGESLAVEIAPDGTIRLVPIAPGAPTANKTNGATRDFKL